jgi:hypothetical protein
MVVVTVTPVPFSTAADETVMVAMLGTVAAPTVKAAGAETEA